MKGGMARVENGEYLPRFSARDKHLDAIEWAVLIANSPQFVDAVIEGLDRFVARGRPV